ncbi:hypothetical protein PVAP13_9KG631601 [Panicum virgatum]|uniref:Uncharacterized protein n=1 Tax=Panicum virgatum TaxID=38727 RepID=A0A8T0P3S3_PANVG|nr:hypothetical protein PVAP13_9KG631601 [Panicum virgatum]
MVTGKLGSATYSPYTCSAPTGYCARADRVSSCCRARARGLGCSLGPGRPAHLNARGGRWWLGKSASPRSTGPSSNSPSSVLRNDWPRRRGRPPGVATVGAESSRRPWHPRRGCKADAPARRAQCSQRSSRTSRHSAKRPRRTVPGRLFYGDPAGDLIRNCSR